ncbi:MAG TPA: nuclear transport factor 2 family protein [Spirochaetota bacterium]
MTDKNVQLRKDTAVQFLELVVAGQIDDAFRQYVDMDGTHHNQYSGAGFPSLRQAMFEAHRMFPDNEFHIMNVIGEKELVAVHSHLVQNPGAKHFTTVHIFRFNGEKITEVWDCIQPLSSDSPNKDGAF